MNRRFSGCTLGALVFTVSASAGLGDTPGEPGGPPPGDSPNEGKLGSSNDAPPARGRRGSRVVSINPKHDDVHPGQPGFEGNPKVHALAYHVRSDEELARCLGNKPFGKPIIISDDGKTARVVKSVLRFIEATAKAGAHYEHFDWHLGEKKANGGGGAMYGGRIDGPEDFPRPSLKILAALGQHATRLTPGGTLTCDGDMLRWDGQPITLMGSSWYGSMVALNIDPEGYLDGLASRGANLTRVWCIEQWTATAWRTDYDIGLTPFAGKFGQYDLTRLNDAFFARLRTFVQAAAARGIVVQVALFDRCGLAKRDRVGEWFDSPYRRANNVNDFLPTPKRGSGRRFGWLYPAFTGLDDTPIGRVNRAFAERVARELGGYGNVIYEIMNEPHHYWPNQTEWHRWVADLLDETFVRIDRPPTTAPTPTSTR